MTPDLHAHLLHALKTAGFVDPDDGTVPMWPHGDVFPHGPVWVKADRLVATVIANLPGPAASRTLTTHIVHAVGDRPLFCKTCGVTTDHPSYPYFRDADTCLRCARAKEDS